MPVDLALERAVRRAFSPRVPIPDASWTAFRGALSIKRLSKGQHLLLAGSLAQQAAFVVRGALREYYVAAEGGEHNKAFVFAGDFTGSYADLLTSQHAHRRSGASIQALRDSVLVLFSFEILLELSERDPVWMKVRCAGAESLLLTKVERERMLLSDNPLRRYRALRALQPELEAKVAQKHIASYLGITPVTLSRLRQKLGLASPARAAAKRKR
jgi:CRP-like cAMP-binding protein